MLWPITKAFTFHHLADSKDEDFEADNQSILGYNLEEAEFTEGQDYFIEDLFVYGRWKRAENFVYNILFLFWLPICIPVFILRAVVLFGSLLFLLFSPKCIKDRGRFIVNRFVFPFMGWFCTSEDKSYIDNLRGKPHVVVSNHTTNFDPLYATCCKLIALALLQQEEVAY